MATTMTMDDAVRSYVQLRDRVAQVKKEQADTLAPFNLAMGKLEAHILDGLNQAGAESIRTVHGTAYKTTRASAKVMNWTETLDFIRTNNAWDLLEARVSKTAVEAIMTETGQAIPGVQTSREVALGVRKS